MGMCFPMLFNHRAKYKMPFWSSETESILKTPNILRKQCGWMWSKCEERLFPENFLGFGVLQHTRAAVEHWFSCLEKLVTNEYKNYTLLGFCSWGKKQGLKVRKQREQSAFGEGEMLSAVQGLLLLFRTAGMALTGEGWERLSSQDK